MVTGKPLGNRGVVRHQDEHAGIVRDQIGKQIDDTGRIATVKLTGRLVGQDEPGAEDCGSGNCDSLPFAPREFSRQVPLPITEPNPFQ